MKGRSVRVPRAAMGVARFSFHDLCEQPLAAADYLRIAHEFHTLILDHIPVMDFDHAQRGQALHHPDRHALRPWREARRLGGGRARRALSRPSDGFEAQEFKRTASRLIEMRSQAYLALPHGRRDSASAGSTEGIVET